MILSELPHLINDPPLAFTQAGDIDHDYQLNSFPDRFSLVQSTAHRIGGAMLAERRYGEFRVERDAFHAAKPFCYAAD
jgi:hypothetical protein